MTTSSTITTPPARYWTLYRLAIALLMTAAVTSVTAYYAGDQIAAAITGKPIIIGDCCGDRAAAAHVFTLYDIQARFADVVQLDEALGYLKECGGK